MAARFRSSGVAKVSGVDDTSVEHGLIDRMTANLSGWCCSGRGHNTIFVGIELGAAPIRAKNAVADTGRSLDGQ